MKMMAKEVGKMLQDVLNKELNALEVTDAECKELGEIMAAGVGCRNASCAGSCSGMSTTAKS